MAADFNLLYRVNEQIRYQIDESQRLRVSVPYGAKALRADPNLAKILDLLANESPQRGTELLSRLSPALIDKLVQYFILIPEPHASILQGGLCLPAQKPAGVALSVHELNDIAQGNIVLCHAPLQTSTDGAVSVARGGRWVRAHLATTLARSSALSSTSLADTGLLVDLDFGETLAVNKTRLFDLGDIVYEPHHDHATNVGRRLAYAYTSIARVGGRPVALGGDHAMAYYTIGALAEAYPKLGILHFDAHPDLYAVGAACDHQLSHANVFHWVRGMPHVQTIWQIGIRDLYYQPLGNVRTANDPKLHALSAFEAETRGYQRLLDQLDPTLPWYISFDVDVLAQTDVPQTATPVLGGLTYYPLLQLFEQIYRRLNIVGLEFVEIGEGPQTSHGPACVAARLLTRYLFHLRNASANPYNVFGEVARSPAELSNPSHFNNLEKHASSRHTGVERVTTMELVADI